MNLKTLNYFAIVLCSFLFFSCNSNCNHKEIKYENEKLSCYPNSNKPSQVITYLEMAEMMDSYDNGVKKEMNKYLKKVSNGKKTTSTDYNWYKLDDLKQYIAYIERISKEKDIPVTGFRIIPTSYPKNYSNKELRNRVTIIFTPTTIIDGKYDAAFEPLYSEKGNPVSVSKYLEQVRAKKVYTGSILPKFESTESSSVNKFPTVPPK
ncbi:hypothetical protein [Polaribacter ponticola]|uniref:Uncharacterized protein n=1 Tax=Polaribacter ponticola TaxID=2978475 RepID=A0ABT5SAE6_9FLAO|nr:hypothetical protein [Polaribacter sp. MSW5]MDD7915084.1 hypothetical protein [Polaribacter sp. MSW5]